MIAAVRQDLPTGTVTFLFTDVEGSTQLLHEFGADAYAEALAGHRRIVRGACTAEGGVEVDAQGDAFFFAFASAPGALEAASSLTEALASGPIQVRVGLHTGSPLLTEEGYVGDDVHFAARVAASGHGGQVVLSRATARLAERELVDLGEHRLKDIAEAVSIYQLGEGSFPPLKTISNTNLPRPASSFVGRERELNEVLAKIEGGARLLTLTGPGGAGKTRLALEAASSLVPEYKAGVFWVGLASLRDPALVTETIAHTLGATDGLPDHIAEREMLLLLDNLEQVIESAPELSALVTSCPSLTLLVTSRELLRISGEVEYPVPPLAGPEAVSLFCERAQLEPSVDIAELCVRLDSLPLALELAAARTKALSPAQVLERLAERLDLLKGGRDADPRQLTLRATIEWSHGLLSNEEQRLFRTLSVFRGGCTLDAAAEVCRADLDTLQALVEKSLLRFTTERYWMLETIREYARERLADAGQSADYVHRHTHYFATRVEQAHGERLGPRRGDVLAWYGAEVDNLRAMLDKLMDEAPAEAARATHALFPFWKSVGAYSEASQRLESLFDSENLTDDLRAQTLAYLAEAQELVGDLDAAGATAAEALRLSAPGTYARVLALLIGSSSEVNRGNVTDGIRLAERAVEEATTLDTAIRISARGDLGMLLVQAGRREEARPVMLDAIGEARKGSLAMNEQLAAAQLGCIDVLDADYESAREALTSALIYARSVSRYPWEAWILQWLGFAYLGLGQRRAARATFGELLELSIGPSKTVSPELVLAMGGLARAVEEVDMSEGALLSGAIAKLREDAGGLRTPFWQQDEEIEDRFEQSLVVGLGEGYVPARAAGAALDVETAVELARSLAAS